MINKDKIKSFFNTKAYFIIGLILLQFFIAIISGLISKDAWYVIVISLIGIIFNMLVSINCCYGFLFGVVYAVTNGILAYYTKIYATFGFMIFMQAPMAIYSFIVWKKNSNSGNTQLKNMKFIHCIICIIIMGFIGAASYFLLKTLNSSNLIYDTIFFVFSVSACILLALRYKVSYIVTLFSGIGGTVLYAMQSFALGVGVSISVFYGIVTINSIIAIFKNYKKKYKKLINSKNLEREQ